MNDASLPLRTLLLSAVLAAAPFQSQAASNDLQLRGLSGAEVPTATRFTGRLIVRYRDTVGSDNARLAIVSTAARRANVLRTAAGASRAAPVNARVLRRTGTQKPAAVTDNVKIGDIEIDFKLHQARRGKARIEFTAREFDLLRYFVQHTGQVVTREQILNEVWGYEEFPTTRTIDNFVAKLRQKIERAPHAPEHILTIHGSGYKFVG